MSMPTEKDLRTLIAQWRKLADMSEELSLHSYTYQHRCWHGGRAEMATELADMLERILTDTEVSEREDMAADALIVAALRAAGFPGESPLPELTAEERAAMDALPPDFIQRLLRGERPLTDTEVSPCPRTDADA